jgi:hypothetical protein
LATFAVHIGIAIAMVFLPAFVFYFIVANRDNLLERERHLRFGTLYDNMKTDSVSTSLFSFFFLMRRMALVAIAVFLYQREYFKIQGFLVLQTMYLIYVGWSRPHIEASFNFLEKLNEFFLIVMGYLMLLMTHYMRDQRVKYSVGWLGIFLCFTLFVINFLLMIVIFLKELGHAYKMYRIRRKFILQYGRKEMIEQNYFKSSRDSGPGKRISRRGASKDDGSPTKSRRRQRRRFRDRQSSSKSSLVQKNDVDDVYVSGEPENSARSDYNDGGYDDHPSTRKFLKKMEANAKAEKKELGQIAEVEENDSEGSFQEDRYKASGKSSRERRRRKREKK